MNVVPSFPQLDFQSSQALLDQITDHYRENIRKGVIPQGTLLPTSRELSQLVGLAPQTINRAFEILAREGLVYRRRSLGTIVGQGPSINPKTGHPSQPMSLPVRRRREVAAQKVCIVIDHGAERSEEVNLLIADYLNGLIEGFSQRGHQFEIRYPEAGQSAEELMIQLVNSGKTNGVVSLFLGREAEDFLIDRKFPFVGINTDLTERNVPCVICDHVKGYSDAWKYVEKLGHRRAVHLDFEGGAGMRSHECAAGRQIARSGIPLDSFFLKPDYTPANLRELLLARLGPFSAGEWPTVFFAAMDHLAMHLIEVLKEMKIRVPEDVSVIGFNDTSIARTSKPRLTTMAKPRQQMAAAAANLLSDLLVDWPGTAGRLQLFPIKMVQRETCAPARAC